MRRRSTAHPAQGGPVPLRGNSWRRAPRPAVAKRRGGSGVTARHRAAVTSQRGGCAFLAFFHTFFFPPFLVFALFCCLSFPRLTFPVTNRSRICSPAPCRKELELKRALARLINNEDNGIAGMHGLKPTSQLSRENRHLQSGPPGLLSVSVFCTDPSAHHTCSDLHLVSSHLILECFP